MNFKHWQSACTQFRIQLLGAATFGYFFNQFKMGSFENAVCILTVCPDSFDSSFKFFGFALFDVRGCML